MSEMTTEGKRALWVSTLWPMLIGCAALLLLTAFVLIFQNFAGNYVREVGGVASAMRASRVTTTWPDGTKSHSIQTTRQIGQSVHDWGATHIDETNGLMAEIGPR